MPAISEIYFKTAISFLLVGIVLGLKMGISGDFAATGAHVHINVLGWVTSALFGGYYALNPARAEMRLAKIQYAVYVVGVLVMTPALYLMLTGVAAAEPFVVAGSIVTFAGVILFAVIVFGRPGKPVAAAPEPAVG